MIVVVRDHNTINLHVDVVLLLEHTVRARARSDFIGAIPIFVELEKSGILINIILCLLVIFRATAAAVLFFLGHLAHFSDESLLACSLGVGMRSAVSLGLLSTEGTKRVMAGSL